MTFGVRHQSAGAQLAWQMTKGFMIAALIGVLALVIESVGIHLSKKSRVTDMVIVNMAREQSILALRVAMLAKRSVHYDDDSMNAASRQQLQTALADLKRTHWELGVILGGQPAYHASPALKEHYEKSDDGLRKQIEDYIGEARAFIASGFANPDDAAALKDRALGGLFDDLETSAALYLAYIDDNAARNRAVIASAQLLILVLLVGVVVFIFRPLTRLAAQKADELETKAQELEKAVEHANAASEAKSAFLATMSHEIRTPLNGILGLADMLNNTRPTPRQSEILKDLLSSGWALLGLLNSILDLTRIEAGKIEIKPEPFDLRQMLDGVFRLHRISIDNKGLTAEVDIAPEIPDCFQGDKDRMTQVLHNLIGNAVKFTHQGSVKLTVSMMADQRLRFTVCDSGIGIPPEQLERVWDRFEQADSALSRGYGGTGLGLAIVRGLVQAMGGEVVMESALGRGTKVDVIVPMIPTEIPQQVLKPDASQEDCRDLRKFSAARLLIAEDNRTNQKIIEALLKRHGFEFSICENGQDAHMAALAQDFDLLLFDISMPVMDGVEALKHIQTDLQDQRRPVPPAVAVSANVMNHHIEQYLTAGFADVLAKPYRADALLTAICKALYNRPLLATLETATE